MPQMASNRGIHIGIVKKAMPAQVAACARLMACVRRSLFSKAVKATTAAASATMVSSTLFSFRSVGMQVVGMHGSMASKNVAARSGTARYACLRNKGRRSGNNVRTMSRTNPGSVGVVVQPRHGNSGNFIEDNRRLNGNGNDNAANAREWPALVNVSCQWHRQERMVTGAHRTRTVHLVNSPPT